MRQFVSERRIPSNYTENASKQDRQGVASFSFRRPIKLRQRRASETTDLRAWRRAACSKSFARFYQEFPPVSSVRHEFNATFFHRPIYSLVYRPVSCNSKVNPTANVSFSSSPFTVPFNSLLPYVSQM